MSEAQCSTHQGPAVAACERCGAFMCERCSRHGVEARCMVCRPKLTKRVHEERRENAVRRSKYVRCLSCGYAGPRVDGFQRAGWGLLLATVLVALTGWGVLFGFAVITRCDYPCAQCGATDSVVPLRSGDAVSDEALQLSTLANRRYRMVYRRNLLALLACIAVWGLVAFGVYWWVTS